MKRCKFSFLPASRTAWYVPPTHPPTHPQHSIQTASFPPTLQDAQLSAEAAHADLSNLKDLQSLYLMVDSRLDSYLSYVQHHIAALAEEMEPVLRERRLERVRKLYRVRKTLANLFSATTASKNDVLQGIEADKVGLPSSSPSSSTTHP